MGDAGVSALVNEVVRRLTSEVIKELALLWGFNDDISTLDQIQVVLEDAEEKHIKEKDVESWLQRLRSASLKVENLLDEISTQAMLQRLRKEGGIKYKVKAFFSSNHNQIMFRVKIARKVKAMRTKLDDIASKRFVLNLTPGDISYVDVGIEGDQMPDRETGALIHDSSLIFGRNEDVETVSEKICNKDIGKYDDGEIRVFAIWGMGGVGKTTLAQLVYNHERVKKDFQLRCWVYVSEKFQVKVIIRKIIEFIDKCGCTLTELSTLQDALQSKLMGNKFLIVLDDVWVEENEKAKWEELSKTLSCGAEGSIIVTTTRSNTTSRMIAKIGELQHELGCLSEDDSWLLFKKFAFAQGREGDGISELESIGREIVEKCKGLPLAVKTLGGLMWSKRSTSDWQRVKDNNIWELQENKVLHALKLSYDNLVPYLKRCFAYCCLFPKGYDMEMAVVIQLWVSNGFIPPRGGKDLYVIGEEIFNCLTWKSFFQVDKDFKYLFKMHDLMHDMARHMMRHDCLVLEPACEDVIIPSEVLHLSSSCPDEKFNFPSEDLEKLASLRSIFMFGELPIFYVWHNSKPQYKFSQIFNQVYLRVLYLVGIELRTLPESICKLKHLRYLNLSHSSIEVLPESIMYLQNLEMLILSSCNSLCKLPESICKIKHMKYLNLTGSRIEVLPEGLKYMTNLQRLDINNCLLLLHLPSGIKELTGLRTLSHFPIGKERGAKINELRDLNFLEGELWISDLENVGGHSEAKSANLKSKANLSVLELTWSLASRRENKREMFAYDEEVLEGLEPSPCLKVLKIYNYMGKTISPSWMVSLDKLVEIIFHGCLNCESIPPLGKLPYLKVMELWRMDRLKCFHDDDTVMLGNTANMFLCLQELRAHKCPNLVSLPSNLPKLKALRLYGCDELVSLPDHIQSFKFMNELVIDKCGYLSKRCEKVTGEDWYKISHIPNIYIDSIRFI